MQHRAQWNKPQAGDQVAHQQARAQLQQITGGPPSEAKALADGNIIVCSCAQASGVNVLAVLEGQPYVRLAFVRAELHSAGCSSLCRPQGRTAAEKGNDSLPAQSFI